MDFLSGKKEDFTDFVNSITKKDRVAIISHNDLDGVASALLVHEFLKSRKIKVHSFYFINYKNGMFGEIHDKLTRNKINKIVMLDINAYSDLEGFDNLRKKFDVFLIDHHPSEMREEKNIIKTRTEDCITFVLYELIKEMADIEKWKELVCATMIAEFSFNAPENLEFIQNIFPDITRENLLASTPAMLSQKITSALIFFRGKEEKVFNLLLKNKLKRLEKYHKIINEEIKRTVEKFRKEAEYYPEKSLYFYYFTPKFSITSIIVSILSIEQRDKTFIFASDSRDEEGYVKVSSRNQSGDVDLNELMRRGVEGLENASGGGHVKASAAMLMKRDLEKFKKNIVNIK